MNWIMDWCVRLKKPIKLDDGWNSVLALYVRYKEMIGWQEFPDWWRLVEDGDPTQNEFEEWFRKSRKYWLDRIEGRNPQTPPPVWRTARLDGDENE